MALLQGHNTMKENAQVHRFGARVAVSLPGTGQTNYLTAKEARTLARELHRCARDVEQVPGFAESRYCTTTVALSNPLRS